MYDEKEKLVKEEDKMDVDIGKDSELPAYDEEKDALFGQLLNILSGAKTLELHLELFSAPV